MEKGQFLALAIGLFSITYGANSFAYLIEWQTKGISNTSPMANNISIPNAFDSGFDSATGSSSFGYASAESSFATSSTGFDLFADVEVGVDQSGNFNANSNSNFSGSFIIKAESGDAMLSSAMLTVGVNSFVETTPNGSEPVFEINNNSLGFDYSLVTNVLNFDFIVDKLYLVYAYEYSVISESFTATGSTSVFNRPGEMNVVFDFQPSVTTVPTPTTLVLFGLGLVLLRKSCSAEKS